MSNTIKIESEFTLHPDDSTLPELERNLLKAATHAATVAYAPYSKFYVGASVLLKNGSIIEGNNQENAAYPTGMCAERVALFNASSNFPEEEIEVLAITLDYNRLDIDDHVFPCGSCRQSILEYERKFKRKIKLLILNKSGEVAEIDGISQLLPLAFTSEMLT